MPKMKPDDLRGANRLLVAATLGTTGMVDAVHASVLAWPRRNGRPLPLDRDPLAASWPDAKPCVLVMVHGLCMNDLQWRQQTHDHGEALPSDLGCSVIHLHYNSGLRIDENGRQLDRLLQALADAWPVRIERMALIGHSMGGLVARAAIAAAQPRATAGWLRWRRWSRSARPITARGWNAPATCWNMRWA